MSGLKKKEYEERIDYYLDKTGLITQQRKKNRQLSGGMKRRVGLVQALLHNPRILIVDEPTTGLDPEERIRIRNLLVDFAADRIVLFSTHVTEDLAATCDKLCILRKGKLTYDGSVTELVSNAENHVFRCSFQNERDFQEFQRNYKVTSKIYKANEIEVRFVNGRKPEFLCELCTPNLEDAFYVSISNLPSKGTHHICHRRPAMLRVLFPDRFVDLFFRENPGWVLSQVK